MILPSDHEHSQRNHHQYAMASVTDRMVAFAIDLFIFIPFIHLALSSLVKKIQLLLFTSSGSSELMMLIFVFLFLSSAIVVFIQSLFVYYWGGTPGKLFLKLKVISTQGPHARITFSQSLLRSFIWALQVFLFFIPFLETLSHRHRRALHDRAAETAVTTLKSDSDSGPHPFESHFIRQILFICFAFFVSWTFFSVSKIYLLAETGSSEKSELIENNELCDAVAESSQNRVDESLALFLAQQVDASCVLTEADFSLWTLSSKNQSWAYLAKSFVNKQDAKLSNLYLEKVCEIENEGEACEIANSIKNQLPVKGSSWTAILLQNEQLEKMGDYKKLSENLYQLTLTNLQQYKIKQQMKSLWASGETDKSRGVFLGGLLSLPEKDQNNLKGWMCAQEIYKSCPSAEVAVACQFANLQEQDLNEEMAWSLIKKQDCLNSQPSILGQLKSVFDKNSYFLKLTKATLLNADQPGILNAKKALQFREIAKSSSGFVKQMAMREWSLVEKSDSGWLELLSLLEKDPHRDWNWSQVLVKAEISLKQSKNKSISRLLSELNLKNTNQKMERLPASVQDEP
jgi:uncharacterized RDD family membrane protein YckC